MVLLYVPREGLPPATHTVASGSNRATEWYSRWLAFAPAEEILPTLGGLALRLTVLRSNRSAFKLRLPVSSSLTEPPKARTLPFGRITAFISIRATLIFGP